MAAAPLPQGHVSVSEDIFGGHTRAGGEAGVAPGI